MTEEHPPVPPYEPQEPTEPPHPGWPQQPPPQPPPQPPQKRPGPFRMGMMGCLGVIVALVIVGIVIAVLASGGSDKGSSDEPASPDATSTASAGRKAGVVLLAAKGTANGNTKQFTSAGDWDLRWSVKCNGSGYVSIDPTGDAFLVGPTTDKTAAGIEHYHQGGKFHLEVVGGPNCSWVVKAITA